MKMYLELHVGWVGRFFIDPNESALTAFLVSDRFREFKIEIDSKYLKIWFLLYKYLFLKIRGSPDPNDLNHFPIYKVEVSECRILFKYSRWLPPPALPRFLPCFHDVWTRLLWPGSASRPCVCQDQWPLPSLQEDHRLQRPSHSLNLICFKEEGRDSNLWYLFSWCKMFLNWVIWCFTVVSQMAESDSRLKCLISIPFKNISDSLNDFITHLLSPTPPAVPSSPCVQQPGTPDLHWCWCSHPPAIWGWRWISHGR